MLNMKVVVLAVLVLASEAIAGRINYSAKYHDGHGIKRTSKLANIEDSHEQQVIDHMAAWSNNKYQAARSKHNFVQVTNTQAAASKGAASGEIQEMEHIVRNNVHDG